ncbi:amidase family protein [Paenibacillus sp. JTLBN-2024]
MLMNVKEYMTYDATGLAALVRNRQVTPEELMQAAFNRLNEVNPELNAVIQTRQDQVLKDIKELHEYQPFAGVPFVLKNISQGIKNEPLTAGALLLKDVKANSDSHFVDRLKQAGFLMIGHTNTPEFGLRNVTETCVTWANEKSLEYGLFSRRLKRRDSSSCCKRHCTCWRSK